MHIFTHFCPYISAAKAQRNKTVRNWQKVSFNHFTDCPFNLATNRQVRMLADLRLNKNANSDDEMCAYNMIYPMCFKTSSNCHIGNYQATMNFLLKSAMKNLIEKIEFFMLPEFQKLSQYRTRLLEEIRLEFRTL